MALVTSVAQAVPGVSITQTGGTTSVSETGPTSDTYTIVLDELPTADVEIVVDPDTQTNVGAGIGSPILLTFTTGNWNVPQTVTVTAVDDAVVEGAHTSTIVHTASSSDGNYNGISIPSVVANVADNDTAGVVITQTGMTTDVNENGPTSDSYDITLSSRPSSNVTITVTADSQVDLGFGPGVNQVIVISPGTWNFARQVIVTAVDDAAAEGPHTSILTHTASSSDTNYNGIAIASVTVNITDNDAAGVSISQSGGSTDVSEQGATSDTYTIVLDKQPTASVTITVDPDNDTDIGAGAGTPMDLVFTTLNWNVSRQVTVTAVDDMVSEGPHISTITHTAVSADTTYNGIAIASVLANVTDNDAVGVTITQSGGTTAVSELGATSDTYTIVLAAQPSADVDITVDPDVQTNLGAGAGTAIVITFTSITWSTPQTITVTAVDDAIAEGPHSSTITHTASSSDGNYNGVMIANVVASVTDNDTAGVSITQSGGSTNINEMGPTSDSYTVELNSMPVANVTVTVDPDVQTDLGSGPGVAVMLTFTNMTWNTPQTITVTAVDDAIAEGAHTSTITHTAASADSNYNGVSIVNVVANITDNDTAGVVITQSGGSTDVSETGPTSDTYTIVLNSEPTANVTITIDPDTQTDLGSGAGTAVNRTFTNMNWNTPQTITVTAVDDAIAEDAHTSTITHTASSGDTVYNGISISNVVANVTDNDTAGVNIVQSGGTTDVNETGPTSDTYTIALNSQPTASVTITITPDNQTTVGSGAGVAVTRTFTTANWNTAQTITVAAINDSVAEGPHISTITHVAASSDTRYNAIAIGNVVASVTDNDTASVTIVQSGGSTNVSETGPTSDTYTIRLNSQPTASVTITIDPDPQTTVGAGAGVAITRTFTTANWNTTQTITVTAVNDLVAEGPHTSTIVHTAASSDTMYNGIAIGSVVANVTDNDTAGVTVTQSGGSTNVNEMGPTSDTYTIVLTSQPTATVTITVDPDVQTNIGAGAGVPVDLTFTTGNWSSAQTVTVTAVDDLAQEGPHTSTITHTAASADSFYNAIAIASVTANVTDNDVPGVTVTQSGGSTAVSETGPTSDTYTINLESLPTANVTITVTPNAQLSVGAGAGVAINLVFTTGNWATPQTVTVTAVDDAVAEGAHTGTITHTAASSDTDYNGFAIANVVANITDNDTANIIVTQSGGSTSVNEFGPTSDTYTIVLQSQPTADVTIAVDPDTQTDIGAGAGTPINLVFTSGNWNSARTVTVTAVDDGVQEGPHTSTITHTAASSDTTYNGFVISNIVVNVTDDDLPGVAISQSGGTTNIAEAGPTSDTYTLTLDSQPSSDVVITVQPDAQSNLGSGAGVAIMLTFTAGNWNMPQTVTVTAVDDAVAEGAHTSTITHTAASADGSYDGISISNVVANITDNDAVGATVVQSGGSTAISETGPTSDTYTIVLNSQPTAVVNVTVTPNSQSNLGAGAGTAVVLMFDTSNWNTPQTVTVTAVDDFVAEGPHTSTISHTFASSDTGYNGLSIANVVANITDNDTVGIVITQSGGSTAVSETGPTSDSYTVVLNSQPTANVSVTVDPDAQTNVGAGSGAPVALSFTTANWSTPQTVIVTAVDDAVAEGAHNSTITHIAASADSGYNGLTGANVIASITDNDTAGVNVQISGGTTVISETGPTSDTYTLVLNSQPTADVTITVTPDSQSSVGAGAGVAVNRVFNAGNWSVAQSVVITAIDDAAPEGPHASVITHSAASADGNYNGIAISNVTADVQDNDLDGVTIDQTSGSTAVSETGPTSDSYTIVLDSGPTANVTITIDTDTQLDLGAGPGVPINITFTTMNWSAPRTVVVTAVDDALQEGPHTSNITHTAASGDPDYNGTSIPDIVVSITDNDIPGVTIVQTGGGTAVSEAGPSSDTYTLVLDSQPTATVNVTITPDNQSTVGAGPGAPIMLVFSTANWSTPQTVTVTAVDDDLAEGSHSSTIAHTVASADMNYNGMTVSNVVAIVTDNDTAGLSITQSGGTTEVQELGATSDSYTISLTSEPTADVTVTITPDQQTSVGGGAGAAQSITFNTSNWNVPQTVTVTAIDDNLAEGSHLSIIAHTVASADANYNGMTVSNVLAIVADNDTVGLSITQSGGSTDVQEVGATSDSYTIALTSQPTADVTVTVTPDLQTSVGSGAGVARGITFNASNWSVPQEVTVTAINDTVAEGPHVSIIGHTVASMDSAYNSLQVQYLLVHIVDDDIHDEKAGGGGEGEDNVYTEVTTVTLRRVTPCGVLSTAPTLFGFMSLCFLRSASARRRRRAPVANHQVGS